MLSESGVGQLVFFPRLMQDKTELMLLSETTRPVYSWPIKPTGAVVR